MSPDALLEQPLPMAKRKETTPSSTVRVDADLAEWVDEIVKWWHKHGRPGITAARYVSPMIRAQVMADIRAVRAEKQKQLDEAEGDTPPARTRKHN